MNITFGICVGTNHNPRLVATQISSILNQCPNNSEILLIGHDLDKHPYDGARIIDFDENEKPGWITRKKNILAEEAKYDVLCLMHDYYWLPMTWYDYTKLFDEENPEWDIVCNKVWTTEFKRSADWMVNPEILFDFIKKYPKFADILMQAAPHENHPKYVNALPYDVRDLWHIQYVSGGYILCKTDVFLNTIMDEDMIWGDFPGEDVDWSQRVIAAGHTIKFNPFSNVYITKPGKWAVTEMPEEVIDALRIEYGSRPL